MSKLKKQLKPIFFPVEKVSIEDYLGPKTFPLTFNDQISHWVISKVKGEDGRVVNACSKNYHLISNEELMTPLIEELESQYDVEASFVSSRGARFYVDFTIKNEALSVMKSDKIYPRIRLNNSYDGSIRYGLDFGFYRQICSNGLWGFSWEKGFKLRHTPGTGAQALPRTMDAIGEFLGFAPKLLKSSYEPLVKHTLTLDTALERVQDVIENTKFSAKKGEAVLARLHEERKTLPLNDFLVYNAFNYALYNDGSKMKQHKKDKLDIQILQYFHKTLK